MRLIALLAGSALTACAPTGAQRGPDVPDMVIDGHNDLLVHFLADDSIGSVESYPLDRAAPGQTDIARWHKGRVGGSFITISGHFAEGGTGLRQMLALLDEITSAYRDDLQLAASSADVATTRAEGRIALIPHLEDGGQLGGSAELLRALYELGLRSVGLTWDHSSDLADAAFGEVRWNGLSPTGRAMIREMNRLGVIVDLSHASDSAALQATSWSKAPVILSHSSTRAVTDVARNVPDHVIRRVAESGGVIMVNFVPYFTTAEYAAWYARGEAVWDSVRGAHEADSTRAVAAMERWERLNPPPTVTVDDVIRHIEHVRKVAGIDHVGLGSDFDGMFSHVRGLEDVAAFPVLLAKLADRGWSVEDIDKLAAGNVLRVWRAVEAIAAETPRN